MSHATTRVVAGLRRATSSKWFDAAGAVVAVGLLAVVLIRAIHDSQDLSFAPVYASLAVVAFGLSWIGLAVSWSILIVGEPDGQTISRWVRSQVWRYVPGAVWAPLVRFAGMPGGGRSRATLLIAESIGILGVAAALGGLVAAFAIDTLWLLVGAIGFVVLVVAGLLARRISGSTRLICIWQAALGLSMTAYFCGAAWSQMAVGTQSGFWDVGAAGLLAWCLGFIVVFAPGGLGAREWAYVAVLGSAARSTASAGAISARATSVVAEALVLCAVLLVARRADPSMVDGEPTNQHPTPGDHTRCPG